MSDEFYNRMATMAARLIKKFGAIGSLKRTTGASIDPVTGVVVGGTTTTYTPYTLLQKFADDMIDGTRILASDRLIILDDTIEPLTTDTITISSQDWNIMSVSESNPAGVAIVYFVQARK